MTVTDVMFIVTLTLVGAAGTAIVAAPAPDRQAVTLSVMGLLLSLLFVLFGAPDVALSQLAVGAVVVPLMVLLAVRRIRRERDGDGDPDDNCDRYGEPR